MLLSLENIQIVHGSFYYLPELLLIYQFVVLKSGVLDKEDKTGKNKKE